MKTLNNTTADQAKDQVSDIQFWGNGDAWKLLGKASSKNEGWMKSSKAYEIDEVDSINRIISRSIKPTARLDLDVPDTSPVLSYLLSGQLQPSANPPGS